MYKCSLVSVDNRHDPIELAHLKPVVIGRLPETKIRDTKVSRKHVELIADCNNRKVAVKQLGANSCKVGDTELTRGDHCDLLHNTILEILAGSYPYSVKFSGTKCQGEDSTNKEGSSSKKSIASFFQKTQASSPLKRKLRHSDEEEENKFKKTRLEPVDEKTDEMDESDDVEMAEVKKKMERMKQTFARKSEVKSTAHSDIGQSSTSNQDDGESPPQASSPAKVSMWEQPDSRLYMYTSMGTQAGVKIAGFDIDGTIITTQSGKVFPTHPGDWKILYAEIPKKIKTLHTEGYKVVFFTNQKGIEKGKVKISDFKKKVEDIISKMGIPIQVFISTGSGRFRKPGLGMWNYLLNNCNDHIKVNLSQCFYVGDAAGRPEKWAPGKKKDFSCSDRLFAINAGLKFYTPEEYFLGQRAAKFNLPEFCPKDIDPHASLLVPASTQVTAGNQEVIVMVGYPASGKSHFVKQHLIPKGYVHVNRDTLKTWQKCVEVTRSSLAKGKSVVVDNTSPDVDSRKRYTEVAKQAGVSCRCFVMNTSFEHAKHNERFREMTDTSHEVINNMVMNSYKTKFTAPQESEGFLEIVKVNVIPDFKSKEHRVLYHMYLMEK